MTIWYDLPRGQFFDEEDRYVNPATVAEKLRQAEADLAAMREPMLLLDNFIHSGINADLKTKLYDSLRLAQNELAAVREEARKWEWVAKDVTAALVIASGMKGDAALREQDIITNTLARYQPGGEW